MTTSKTSRPHAAHQSPWEHGNPKAADEHQHLSPRAKAAAKRRAKKAGRPYPNLVDNMAAARGKA